MAAEALLPLVRLLQLADGLFPAGGFAHSFGLETYTQRGRVRDREGLAAFLTAHLEGSAGPCDAAAVALAARRGVGGDLEGCLLLDAELDARKPVAESRDASRQMGRQTARVAARLDPADGFLIALTDAIERGETPGHHAVAFGAVTGRAGVDPAAAAAAFLHSTAALLVGAGLRLLPIGQLEAQQVLGALGPRIARLARRAGDAGPDDLWSFAPGLEIAGWHHAALDSRLFRS